MTLGHASARAALSGASSMISCGTRPGGSCGRRYPSECPASGYSRTVWRCGSPCSRSRLDSACAMATDGHTWSAPAATRRSGPGTSSTGMRASGSSHSGPEWSTYGSGRPPRSHAGPPGGQLAATTLPGTVAATPQTRMGEWASPLRFPGTCRARRAVCLVTAARLARSAGRQRNTPEGCREAGLAAAAARSTRPTGRRFPGRRVLRPHTRARCRPIRRSIERPRRVQPQQERRGFRAPVPTAGGACGR